MQIDDQHDLHTLQAEPKDGVFTKLDDKETAPSRCLSIFMYTFNSDGKVNDIKFLRQPSKDEMARKVHPCPWHYASQAFQVAYAFAKAGSLDFEREVRCF